MAKNKFLKTISTSSFVMYHILAFFYLIIFMPLFAFYNFPFWYFLLICLLVGLIYCGYGYYLIENPRKDKG